MGTTTEELKRLYNKIGGTDENTAKTQTPAEVLKEIYSHLGGENPNASSASQTGDILRMIADLDLHVTVGPQPEPPAPGGGDNDVMFIDYDGTVVHSYTKDQFLALEEMPENPEHEGLTAQGWNWSFENAHNYVEKYGRLIIGQMYITDDGKTRLHIRLEEGRLNPEVGLGLNGTAVIDWGDGSEPDTITGTNLNTATYKDHVYASTGEYVISIEITDGAAQIFGTSSRINILRKVSKTNDESTVYYNALLGIYLGSNIIIGEYAFQSCYSLANVTIPDSVTSIGAFAFNNCYSLANVTIPDSVMTIRGSVFQNCLSLHNVAISDSVRSMGNGVFQNCYSLDNVTIPDSVTSIGGITFNGCYSLNNVTIPDSVTSLLDGVFQDCHSLVNISIPDSVTSIRGSVFQNCNSLANVTIPDSVTSIGSNAFRSCNSLNNVTIPDSVTSISDGAFQNCNSLANVTIPDSVTSIGSNAFQSCYSLANVTIPDSVTSIVSSAFQKCLGLGFIKFKSITPPTVGGSVWTSLPIDCKILVPTGTIDAYKAAANMPNPSTYTYEEYSE